MEAPECLDEEPPATPHPRAIRSRGGIWTRRGAWSGPRWEKGAGRVAWAAPPASLLSTPLGDNPAGASPGVTASCKGMAFKPGPCFGAQPDRRLALQPRRPRMRHTQVGREGLFPLVHGLVEVTQQKQGGRARTGSQSLHVCPAPGAPAHRAPGGPRGRPDGASASDLLRPLSDLPIHKTGVSPSHEVAWRLDRTVDIHNAPT